MKLPVRFQKLKDMTEDAVIAKSERDSILERLDRLEKKVDNLIGGLKIGIRVAVIDVIPRLDIGTIGNCIAIFDSWERAYEFRSSLVPSERKIRVDLLRPTSRINPGDQVDVQLDLFS